MTEYDYLNDEQALQYLQVYLKYTVPSVTSTSTHAQE